MEGARYLEDGKLTVFRRAGIYYARIRIAPRQYIWRSLKTSNEQTAVDLGRRLLFQLEHRADQGLPPKSKLFAAIIDDYIRYRERDHRHGGTSAGCCGRSFGFRSSGGNSNLRCRPWLLQPLDRQDRSPEIAFQFAQKGP